MTPTPASIPINFISVTTDQNWTNNTECPGKNLEQWAYSVLQAYILLVSVLGIMLNLFVLMVFCFHKKPCTVTEIYMINLAVADFVLVSFLPFWAASASNQFMWPFGRVLCQVVNLAIIMNMYCSIYFLVLVSVNRYLTLVHPMSHKKLRTPHSARVGCLLVWVLGLLLSVPTLIYRKVGLLRGSNNTICYLDYPNKNVLLLSEGMLTTFSFIIPICFISYCTWKIIRTLNNQLMKGLRSQKMEQKANTLILTVLLAFLICWVPLHLVRIMEALLIAKVLQNCKLKTVIVICKQTFIYLAFFNSVLNPILYVIVWQNFRKKVQEVFRPLVTKTTAPPSDNSKLTYLWRIVKTEDVSR